MIKWLYKCRPKHTKIRTQTISYKSELYKTTEDENSAFLIVYKTLFEL
jgi:hypothetical protein